jgi:hypothetical protein
MERGYDAEASRTRRVTSGKASVRLERPQLPLSVRVHAHVRSYGLGVTGLPTRGVVAAIRVARDVDRELDNDYVGLWKLPWHIRRKWTDVTEDQVHLAARAVLEALTEIGVSIGQIDFGRDVFLPEPPTAPSQQSWTHGWPLGTIRA